MLKKLLITLLLVSLVSPVFATVTSTETKRQFFTCNGTATTYTFTMECNSSDDIRVEKRVLATGVPTGLVEDTDYTITNTGSSYLEGGVVTIDPALASTYQVVIVREIVQTQETVAGAITPATVVLALDKVTRLTQDARNDIDQRVLRIPDSDPSTAYSILANSVERAGYWLGFDSTTGAPYVGMPAATGISVSAFMATVNDDATSALARGTLELGTGDTVEFADIITKGPWFDVRAFLPDGYVTDGSVDYATQIQAAIDEIKTVGNGCLLIPLGTFRVNTSLDCTGFLGAVGTTYKGLNIKGVSMNGSRILGATSGKPIFDFTASGYCSMENLRITGHTSNQPNVAILLARNTGAGSAGVHNFRRVFVEGEFTKGGIYNFASEENVYDNVRITITGGGATWCITFTNSNFESISSDYETILAASSPMTRTTLIAPQFKMNYEIANGTCLYSYGAVRDLACYGGYMYSESQSHVKLYAVDTTNSPRRILFDNLRAERGTTKPDYSIFMTGASDGNFDAIELIDCYFDAHTYYIYQDNTVTGSFSNSRLIMNRPNNATEMKFNKVLNSQINIPLGDFTVDTTATKLDITNWHTGTITLPADADMIVKRDFGNRLFTTKQIPQTQSIGTLDNTGTPSIALGNLFKTGGTTTITDFDDGIEGQIITIIAEHSLDITDGTNIFLDGSANWSMTATDTLTLICKADNKWYEISRSDSGA